jgi:hypothetical protein
VANAGLVILEPLLESKYCDDATHESGGHMCLIFSTALVVVSDKQTRGVVLCYKYTAEQMIAQGRGGRIIQ